MCRSPPTLPALAAKNSRWSTTTLEGTALLTTVVKRSSPSFKAGVQVKVKFHAEVTFSSFKFAANGDIVEANSGPALKKKKTEMSPQGTEVQFFQKQQHREATFRPAALG